MPYTVEDFRREYVIKHLNDLTTEERLKGLPAEELLKALSLRQRLAGLVPAVLLNSLSEESITQLLSQGDSHK